MAIDYPKLMSFPFEDAEHAYTPRDTMLYALAVGLGADPVDERQLRFVYEKNLVALPSMGVLLARCKPWVNRPESGITWQKMLHGEQGLVLHRPIPSAAVLVGDTRLQEIVDKGAGKGALLYMTRTVRDRFSGEAIVTATQTLFCRADGGFGGKVTQSPPPHELPARDADIQVELPTLPQSALLYRLTGDVNPLHVDPQVAAAAGFPRPILHGLCTFAIAEHAILRSVLNYESAQLRSLRARFAAPVFPGETIHTEIWHEGGGKLGFRCSVLERKTLVINNGLAEIG